MPAGEPCRNPETMPRDNPRRAVLPRHENSLQLGTAFLGHATACGSSEYQGVRRARIEDVPIARPGYKSPLVRLSLASGDTALRIEVSIGGTGFSSGGRPRADQCFRLAWNWSPSRVQPFQATDVFLTGACVPSRGRIREVAGPAGPDLGRMEQDRTKSQQLSLAHLTMS